MEQTLYDQVEREYFAGYARIAREYGLPELVHSLESLHQASKPLVEYLSLDAQRTQEENTRLSGGGV